MADEEKKLNQKVVNWINSLHQPYCFAYKRRGTAGNRGMPDVSGSIFGIRVEIEGKIGDNTPTPKQFYWLDVFYKAGAISGWYNSLEKAQELVIKQAEKKGIWIQQHDDGTWNAFKIHKYL